MVKLLLRKNVLKDIMGTLKGCREETGFFPDSGPMLWTSSNGFNRGRKPHINIK